MKLQEQYKAIELRKLGKSYSEIRKEMRVSKSSLSRWLKDVKLTPAQEERLYVELRAKNAYRLVKENQRKRVERTERIVGAAKQQANTLLKDPLFLAGLMLYWAEGDKSEKSEYVKFSNSDPAMIKFMMKWFRKICRIPEDKFRIELHIHKLHCRKDIENYWSKVVGIPLSQFYKTQIKPTSLGQRKNYLYNGTCAIRIGSKDLFRKIKGWKLGFIEVMNIRVE